MSSDQSSRPPSQVTAAAITDAVNVAFPGALNRCHSTGNDWALAVSEPDAMALRPGGYISGPTQFALADAALWFMTFVAIDNIELMALTSELSIRYLRPAIGKTLWAKAKVEKVGRRSVVGTVHIWVDDNEDKPSATAQGTYMLPAISQ